MKIIKEDCTIILKDLVQIFSHNVLSYNLVITYYFLYDDSK